MIGYLRYLALFRRSAGLTQQNLASFLKTGQANIARIEKEKVNNYESISLKQAEDWLRACGLTPIVNADLITPFTKAISKSPEVCFVQEFENMLRCKDIAVDLQRKSLLTVCVGDEEDFELQTLFVRSLLNSGDTKFLGYYLPPEGCTILWKHINDRPSDKDHDVYLLEGVLESWMRWSPLQSLTNRESKKSSVRIKNSGGFFSLYKYVNSKPLENHYAVVYSDHPLLRFFDVVQVPPFSSEIRQSFHNFRMAINSEISILCSSRPNLTASTLVTALCSGKEFDFIVYPKGCNVNQAQETFERLYKKKPNVFFIDEFGDIDYVAEQFKKLVLECTEYKENEIKNLMGDATYPLDKYNIKIKRKLPELEKIEDIHERILLFFSLINYPEGFSNASEAYIKLKNIIENYNNKDHSEIKSKIQSEKIKLDTPTIGSGFPLTLQQSFLPFFLAHITMNHRFNSYSLKRIDITKDDEAYVSLLRKTLKNIDESTLREISEAYNEMYLKIPESTRKLVTEIWEKMKTV